MYILEFPLSLQKNRKLIHYLSNFILFFLGERIMGAWTGPDWPKSKIIAVIANFLVIFFFLKKEHKKERINKRKLS